MLEALLTWVALLLISLPAVHVYRDQHPSTGYCSKVVRLVSPTAVHGTTPQALRMQIEKHLPDFVNVLGKTLKPTDITYTGLKLAQSTQALLI